jgi:acyl carrier protein
MLSTELVAKVRRLYEGVSVEPLEPAEIAELRGLLRTLVSEEAGIAVADLDENATFADLGVDSVAFLQVFDEVKKAIGLPIPTGELLSFARTRRMATLEELLAGLLGFLESRQAVHAT